MAARILIVTAVEQEAEAVGTHENCTVVISGVGRTNAAVATTLAIFEQGPFDAIISAGVAGALPESNLALGDVIVASHSVYVEEGIITPEGFRNTESMGFPLGDIAGNAVPADDDLLAALSPHFVSGKIATVATCSGTNAAAAAVVERTGARAEAMEGAAVVHAARLSGQRAIELRAISNTTGDRDQQQWDLPQGLAALRGAVPVALAAIHQSLHIA